MRRSRSKIGISIVSLLFLGLLATLYGLLRSPLIASLPGRLCIPIQAADTACYEQSTLISPAQATAIALDAAGTTLAFGDQASIQVWNLKTGERTRDLKGHSGNISAIAISPDGRKLASSSLDGTLKFWELSTGTLIGTVRSGRASCLTFSPDGQTIASGSRVTRWADGSYSPPGVQFWDWDSEQRLYSLGEDPMQAIAFSPDGQLLAAGHQRTDVWHIQDGEMLHQLNSGHLTGLAFSRDGQVLLSGSSKVKLWDLSNGKLLDSFDTGASDLVLSPDEQVLAIAVGERIHLWQVQNRQLLGALRGSWHSGLWVRFALEGQAIVSGGSDGVRIWRPTGVAPV